MVYVFTIAIDGRSGSASRIYSTATGTCQSTKIVRYQELSVVSHKQVHQCAASKVVCAMSSGRYLNLRGRGSSFDRSRLARRMTNFDTPALPTAEQGVVASLSYPVPSWKCQRNCHHLQKTSDQSIDSSLSPAHRPSELQSVSSLRCCHLWLLMLGTIDCP